MLGTFASPRKTLVDRARRPTFLVSLLVAWVASMSLGLLFANRVLTGGRRSNGWPGARSLAASPSPSSAKRLSRDSIAKSRDIALLENRQLP